MFINSMSWFILLIALMILLMLLLVWLYYPRKGQRRRKKPVEYRPEEKVPVETSPEDTVRAVLIKRVEGIKNRNARLIASIVDKEKYTKFDDWPPFRRQDSHALDMEADALKVLKEYDYEVKDWKINVFGDAALASFTIRYHGTVRELKFDIHSRVTAFLVKRGNDWKLVHEHWSRFPDEMLEDKI